MLFGYGMLKIFSLGIKWWGYGNVCQIYRLQFLAICCHTCILQSTSYFQFCFMNSVLSGRKKCGCVLEPNIIGGLNHIIDWIVSVEESVEPIISCLIKKGKGKKRRKLWPLIWHNIFSQNEYPHWVVVFNLVHLYPQGIQKFKPGDTRHASSRLPDHYPIRLKAVYIM